jgi:RNA polymerase sigma-70 factor (ECF subfamily)
MLTEPAVTRPDPREDALIAAAAGRDETAIRTIVRRYNQRLYRLARSILKDDTDAEDAVQQAYVKAFAGIGAFRGESRLGTWLSRIVINVALDAARKRRPTMELLDAEAGLGEEGLETGAPSLDPERSLAQREIGVLMERAIDALPPAFRTVLVARVVEGMSIEETAELLDIRPETVKTRLHRARSMVKQALEQQLGPALTGVFPFLGWRCDRMADAVVAALKQTA